MKRIGGYVVVVAVVLLVLSGLGRAQNRPMPPIAPTRENAFLPIVVSADAIARPTVAPDVVQVLGNHSAYEDSDGELHIVGEVQNGRSNTVHFIKVSALVFNEAGQFIDTDHSYVQLYNLPPGEKVCFHIWLDKLDWARYEFEAPAYSAGGDPWPRLVVWNDSGIFNAADGSYKLLGMVRNDESSRVETVQAMGTLYDAAGKVVGCNSAYVNSTNLEPGQSSGFEMNFWWNQRDWSDVVSYRVKAE